MKYKARICIRRGILDNAGQATTQALKTIGYPDVENVRIDRLLEFNLEEADWKKAEAIVKSQTNEVMEYYELEEIIK